MEEAVKKLGTIIRDAVKIKPASGILFSGGLDSTILASLDRDIKAVTISLGTYGEDIAFSKSISKFLQMEHRHKALSLDEAIGAIPDVIRILQCFDPAIPSDSV